VLSSNIFKKLMDFRVIETYGFPVWYLLDLFIDQDPDGGANWHPGIIELWIQNRGGADLYFGWGTAGIALEASAGELSSLAPGEFQVFPLSEEDFRHMTIASQTTGLAFAVWQFGIGL
jgi:hypothetical protein